MALNAPGSAFHASSAVGDLLTHTVNKAPIADPAPDGVDGLALRRRPAALAADGEQVDPRQLREDGVAVGCAVGRVAGRHHQLVVAHRLQDPDVARIDDLVPLDRIGEGRVGHLDSNLVAFLDLVDVPEGRQVGGPVARNGHRAGCPGNEVFL